jgi:hypothetical protein
MLIPLTVPVDTWQQEWEDDVPAGTGWYQGRTGEAGPARGPLAIIAGNKTSPVITRNIFPG